MLPAICRAGRALVDMTQAQLAERAKVALATVKNFEAGRTTPMPKNMADMRAALEAAGVRILDGDEPGVRLVASKKSGRSRAK